MLDKILALVPEETTLMYVDQGSSFDGYEKLLQEAISKRDMECIYNKIDEWFFEQGVDNMYSYIDKIKADLYSNYNLESDEVNELMDLHEDSVIDKIFSNCTDTTLEDLIRNTSKIVASYDTGHRVPTSSMYWNNYEMQKQKNSIKEFLEVGKSQYKYNKDIIELMREATYGGNLVIYFNLDLSIFLNNSIKDINSIEFTSPNCGIVNHYNGSGSDLFLQDHVFKLPFNISNIFLEKAVKYNWTYDIAGLSENWAEDTKYTLLKEKHGEVIISDTNDLVLQEEKYNNTFKKGLCTFNDIDMNRHRETKYSNNYPCGHTCTKCGTFWID
tara:strand:- start:6883 stop:7866 length:984 start_codon:yes stop_codon:yes gene_type:complete